MARLEIRLSDGDKGRLEAEALAAGRSLSDLVRERVLGVSRQEMSVDVEGLRLAVNDHEARLERLEGVAGL